MINHHCTITFRTVLLGSSVCLEETMEHYQLLPLEVKALDEFLNEVGLSDEDSQLSVDHKNLVWIDER